MVSEYQQYQDATIDDDEYFEGDEVEQEEAWTTGNSSMMQSPTPTPCRQTHENIETADELYLILPSFFMAKSSKTDKDKDWKRLILSRERRSLLDLSHVPHLSR